MKVNPGILALTRFSLWWEKTVIKNFPFSYFNEKSGKNNFTYLLDSAMYKKSRLRIGFYTKFAIKISGVKMVFEHFALNIAEPQKIASWYVENCQMVIVKKLDSTPFTHFLADKTGRVVMEIYQNDSAELIDLREMHPLEFHFALMVENADDAMAKLQKAGATLEEDLHLEDGSHLVMLRDPFGISLQLCQRERPLFKF